MAQKWANNDSARTMTKKYNEMVDQINGYEKTNQNTEQVADDIKKLLDGKVDKETAKKDLGVDKVDNTSDMDKPLSNPQARAIENATEGMLTSEPSEDIDIPLIGVLVDLRIQGTKLLLSTDTESPKHKVNVFVRDTKLVFIAI